MSSNSDPYVDGFPDSDDHVYSNFQKGDEVWPSDPIYLDANCHIDFPVRFLSSNEAPTMTLICDLLFYTLGSVYCSNGCPIYCEFSKAMSYCILNNSRIHSWKLVCLIEPIWTPSAKFSMIINSLGRRRIHWVCHILTSHFHPLISTSN